MMVRMVDFEETPARRVGPASGPEPEENPLRRRIAEAADWKAGAALAAFFAVLHAFTSTFWVFPGDSARYVATILGVEPLAAPSEQLFVGVFRLFSLLGGTAHRTAAAAVLTLFFSSACLLLTYLFVVGLCRMLADLPHLKASVIGGEAWTWRMPRMAGVVATCALGFSAPFWTASTRVNSDSFHFAFLLLAAYLLLRFMATDRLSPLYAAAAVYGVLCTQSAAAVQFLPLFACGAVFASLRGERPVPATLLAPAAIAGAAAAVSAAVCVWAFMHGEAYRLLRYAGPGAVFSAFVRSSFGAAFSGLFRPHWLVIGSTTLVPFAAWLVVGKWRLDGSRNAALRILDFAILLSALLVLSCSRYSPWGLFGFRAEQVVAYALASMSLAYCVAASHQQALFLFSARGAPPFPGARVFGAVARGVLLTLVAAFVAYEAKTGLAMADARPAKFLLSYVDALVDGLGGRDLLVTDFVLEDVVRIRARERGLDVAVINPAAHPASTARRRMREKIEDPVLLNAFDLGIFPFLQEYVGHHPEAGSRVALTFFPDIWNIGPYRAYPSALCFVGVPETCDPANPLGLPGDDPLAANAGGWRSFAAKIGRELDAVPENSSPAMLAAAAVVRRRVSFVGNNLAYWLSVNGRAPEGLALWRDVHDFDPENLSATLNLFSALDRAGASAERDAVRAELDEFRRKMTKPFQIWELSRSQGYVASPELFTSLGLSWALTGQASLALGTLESAMRDGIGGGRDSRGASRMLVAIGAISGKIGDAEAAERAFEETLANDPGNAAALAGLVRARLSQGDLEGVEALFDALEESGIDRDRLVHVRANYLVQKGDVEAAVALVRSALEESPRNPELLLDLFTASTSQFASSTNPAVRIEARKRMEDTVQRLRSDPEARTFHGAIASAALHLVDQEYAEARDEFRIADKTSPGVPALLNQILRLDYGLQDRVSAEEHAREILRIVPDHGFANYIMGSLALSAGRYDSAKAFLERSVRSWDSALPRGDLAYALYHFRDNGRAETLARDAISRADGLYAVWDTLGLVLMAQGRPEEAHAALSEAVARRSDARIVHLHLARAELMLGHRDAARRILDDLQNVENRFHGDDRAFYNDLWRDLHASSGETAGNAK